VTKKEIVKQISDETGLTQLQAKKIVGMTFDAIIATLVREERIELRNFGVFEVKLRKARKARNPRTNEDVFVGPKNVVTFQPGKKMEESVREMPLVQPKQRKPRKIRVAALDGSRSPALVGAGVSTSSGEAAAVPSENGSHASHSEPVSAGAKKPRKRKEK